MDLVALAQTTMGTVDAVDIGLIVLLAALCLVFIPRGRATRRHNVFIAADPRTVWDTYFFHVGHREYRPGIRFLDCKILAEKPLIVRYTVQADYARTPIGLTFAYDVYEPYSRYRLTAEGDLIEEGELQQEAGGTWLRVAITSPRRGWLFPWALHRRSEKNYRALKDVCEGRAPEPQRPPPPAHWWDQWATGSAWLSLAAIFVFPFMGLPRWIALLLLVPISVRWARSLLRLLALA